ncbi:MAG: thiamine biosynthesis protein [Desulfobulbus sp.]|jgi:tRNA U34 2-thiouridine synthase MnmA/TrmU|uniref:thiamine biosynthesis protein n=1 Tax=Desulfobulbus sp. TaxID=895 RepID=UPI00283D9D0D|nr:thiamine biosynthesis protein [Desulfobulbus sp.]MDR2548847.1 thiamine biosynthesis protein [Desulfobulbus sp.]
MSERVALGLFSGGLDSILACRTVADQGVRVVALKFVTPFFDHDLLAQQREYGDAMRRKYGLEVEVVDISAGYLRLLDNPAHGFGKHFNPCIDCKILMLTKARELMSAHGAAFLLTGEVLGQRPMSQRRDTLRVIERDSGCAGLLLRPLCAKLMPPTRAELDGLVDRERLHGFSGRGRKEQKQLAARLGIADYPTPAGGCMLTDPNLAARIKHFYQGLFSFGEERAVDDIRLLTVGRQFKLDDDTWLILGRSERENDRLLTMRGPDDWLLRMATRPGPLGLLRHARSKLAGTDREEEILRRAAGLVVRYGRKEEGIVSPAEVRIDQGDASVQARFAPLADAEFAAWRI